MNPLQRSFHAKNPKLVREHRRVLFLARDQAAIERRIGNHTLEPEVHRGLYLATKPKRDAHLQTTWAKEYRWRMMSGSMRLWSNFALYATAGLSIFISWMMKGKKDG